LQSLKNGLYPRLTLLLFPPAGNQVVEYRHFEDDGRHELSSALYSEWKIRIVHEDSGGMVTVEQTACGLAEPAEGRFFTLELPLGFSFSGGSREDQFNTAAFPLNKIYSISYTGNYQIAGR
jgi:hypothetical protein